MELKKSKMALLHGKKVQLHVEFSVDIFQRITFVMNMY